MQIVRAPPGTDHTISHRNYETETSESEKLIYRIERFAAALKE